MNKIILLKIICLKFWLLVIVTFTVLYFFVKR